MKILVCISSVPDTTSKIAFEEGNTRFSKAGIQYIIGPYDDYALARGVELKEATGGSLTVLNVGQAAGLSHKLEVCVTFVRQNTTWPNAVVLYGPARSTRANRLTAAASSL